MSTSKRTVESALSPTDRAELARFAEYLRDRAAFDAGKLEAYDFNVKWRTYELGQPRSDEPQA